jgi:hypothetical protein
MQHDQSIFPHFFMISHGLLDFELLFADLSVELKVDCFSQTTEVEWRSEAESWLLRARAGAGAWGRQRRGRPPEGLGWRRSFGAGAGAGACYTRKRRRRTSSHRGRKRDRADEAGAVTGAARPWSPPPPFGTSPAPAALLESSVGEQTGLAWALRRQFGVVRAGSRLRFELPWALGEALVALQWSRWWWAPSGGGRRTQGRSGTEEKIWAWISNFRPSLKGFHCVKDFFAKFNLYWVHIT